MFVSHIGILALSSEDLLLLLVLSFSFPDSQESGNHESSRFLVTFVTSCDCRSGTANLAWVRLCGFVGTQLGCT